MNELVFSNPQGQRVTTSLLIAEKFHKSHKNVLQAIAKLSYDQEFMRLNFQPHEYIDARGNTQPMYYITKDGFMLLVFGFNGRDANKLKIMFIEAFNAGQEAIAVLDNDDAVLARAFDILAKKQKDLENQLEQKTNQLAISDRRIEIAKNRLEEVAPKVEFSDRIHGSSESYEFKKAAKLLKLPFGRNILLRKLRADKIFMAGKGSRNEPYQSYIDQGLFVFTLIKEAELTNTKTGQKFTKKFYKTYVTGKGMYWLANRYEGKNPKYRTNSTELTIF